MAIRKVARMGHPVLRQRTRDLTPEEIRSDEVARLVEDMIETMEEYGGIGLAAPQVHEPVRLAIIGFDGGSARYPGMGEQELTVLVNPRYKPLSENRQAFWEGCLSVPGLRGLVSRPDKIQVDFLDLRGEPHSVVAEGFLATVFQHELDHLDGVLYVDRVEKDETGSRLAFQEEYEKYWAPAAREDGDEEGPGELPD